MTGVHLGSPERSRWHWEIKRGIKLEAAAPAGLRSRQGWCHEARQSVVGCLWSRVKTLLAGVEVKGHYHTCVAWTCSHGRTAVLYSPEHSAEIASDDNELYFLAQRFQRISSTGLHGALRSSPRCLLITEPRGEAACKQESLMLFIGRLPHAICNTTLSCAASVDRLRSLMAPERGPRCFRLLRSVAELAGLVLATAPFLWSVE